MNLSVGNCEPKTFGSYPSISEAMKTGAVIHCFRSGGGLRVVRLEKPRHGELLGYGEHPYIEQAFDYCEEDCRLGGQDYKKVYGEKYPHYVTGSSSPSSEVDRWVLSGRETDFTFEDGEFVFRGEYRKSSIPQDVWDRVMATRISERVVDSRGFVYKVTPSVYPDGTNSTRGSVVEIPEGYSEHDAYEYKVPIISRADSLENLFSMLQESLPLTWKS